MLNRFMTLCKSFEAQSLLHTHVVIVVVLVVATEEVRSWPLLTHSTVEID